MALDIDQLNKEYFEGVTVYWSDMENQVRSRELHEAEVDAKKRRAVGESARIKGENLVLYGVGEPDLDSMMVQMGSNSFFLDLILNQLMQQTKDFAQFEPLFNHCNKHRPGPLKFELLE